MLHIAIQNTIPRDVIEVIHEKFWMRVGGMPSELFAKNPLSGLFKEAEDLTLAMLESLRPNYCPGCIMNGYDYRHWDSSLEWLKPISKIIPIMQDIVAISMVVGCLTGSKCEIGGHYHRMLIALIAKVKGNAYEANDISYGITLPDGVSLGEAIYGKDNWVKVQATLDRKQGKSPAKKTSKSRKTAFIG